MSPVPALPDSVTLTEGEGELPLLRVATAVATGEIYLHGAQVTAWSPAAADPVLWVSGASAFAEGEAIRGGVPICFPWFGRGREPGLAPPSHGFARLPRWRLVAAADRDGIVTLGLELTNDDVRHVPAAARWPHTFTARATVTFGAELELSLEVVNTGDREISFECALHTYLAVADVRATSISGLDGARFLDKVTGAHGVQAGDVTFAGETDRVYQRAGTVVVDDGTRSIGVTSVGAADTVVWNPWAEKAATMVDLGSEEWPGFVCVETANVLGNAVTLAPTAGHTMSARYTVTRRS